MRSKIRSNIVVVGIAPWGVIQGREQLKGQNVSDRHCISTDLWWLHRFSSKRSPIIQQPLSPRTTVQHWTVHTIAFYWSTMEQWANMEAKSFFANVLKNIFPNRKSLSMVTSFALLRELDRVYVTLSRSCWKTEYSGCLRGRRRWNKYNSNRPGIRDRRTTRSSFNRFDPFSLTVLLQVSVVVIDGSGRAADLIAFTYKHTQNNAYD